MNETTNKQSSSPAIRRINQGVKSMPSSENIQPRTGHNPRDSRPITRIQTTDSPSIKSNEHQPRPFKLVPVLPPNKKIITNVKPSAQSELIMPNKQVEGGIALIQSVINCDQVLRASTVCIQIQEEAMMLRDDAIVSMIMGSAPTIVEKTTKYQRISP